MESGSDPVRQQYERWPYPPPKGETLEEWEHYRPVYEILRNMAPRFWPAGKPREDLRILSAGCGTMAAAFYAWLYPECHVTGLDLSAAALAHEEKLRQRYGLRNLTLRQGAIEEAAGLGASFDYISCHGVLHHTQEPAAALRVLGSLLSEEGIIRLSLYGKYPREQVYAFQEFFRLLDLQQVPEDIALARETLATLPLEHPLQTYLRGATDHRTDAGLVDTYLHRRDQPYTVPDCLALVEAAGLEFQGWDMNFDYFPEGPLRHQPALRARMAALPEEQVWHAMEILSGTMRMHSFHVCRRDRDPATWRIPWGSERLLDCVPGHCVDLLKVMGPTEGWAMGRGSLPALPLTPPQAALFAQIDGRRNLRQCLAAAGVAGSPAEGLATAEPLLRLLWRTGYGVFLLPRPPRPPGPGEG